MNKTLENLGNSVQAQEEEGTLEREALATVSTGQLKLQGQGRLKESVRCQDWRPEGELGGAPGPGEGEVPLDLN
jgi:hypothetical protein